MGITVLSPHDGQPVKVRDQDVGRAVRDREKRIFYVLPKSDGSGHYGALTRAGGEKDELRAIELENKVAQQQKHARDTLVGSASHTDDATPSPPVHDATGKRRSRAGRNLILILILLLIAAAAAGYYFRDQIRDRFHENFGPPRSAVPLPRLVLIYTAQDVPIFSISPLQQSQKPGIST